jgi:hypothetical protein
MRCLPVLMLVTLAACAADPDARTTAREDQLTAKAVADVDAAMKDAAAKPPKSR